jgi:hypothetical protein
MTVLEYATTPFDLVRGPTLRFLTRSGFLKNILSRRDTRVAALGTVQVLLLFGITLRWPVALYFLGPVVFGVVHLAADVRYLVFRVTPPRLLLLASVALAVGLTAVRLCVGLNVASITLGARIDIILGAIWVGLALVLRLGSAPRKLALAAPLFVTGTTVMVMYAVEFDLAITQLHNLVAFAMWFALFRRRLTWTVIPLVLVVVATAILLSGASLPWTQHHGGLVAFGLRAARLGSGFLPGVTPRVASTVACTFVFLQSVHYAIWTGWIPQDSLRGEGTPTFRMTARSLLADFGPVALACVVCATLGFAALACWHMRQSVGWYMTLTRAHIWFELAVFAYFVGRDRVACALQVHSVRR